MQVLRKIFANRLIPYISILLFGLILAVSLKHYYVNVPYADQWDIVPYFEKVDSNTLGLRDLFAQHNEHRIPFPLTVLLISAYLTNWNTGAEIAIGFLISLITIALIIRMLQIHCKDKTAVVIASFLCAAWFFSPAQWENWLWGWQVEWFMNIAAVAGVIYLLTSVKKAKHYWYVMLAGVLAFIATFSLGSGLLVWFIGMALLVASKQIRELVRVWLPMTVVSLGVYYYNYVRPSYLPSPVDALHQPIELLAFYVSLFGRSIATDRHTTTLIGAVLLSLLVPLVYAVALTRKNLKMYLPGLGLMAYGMLAAFITTLSRAGLGTDYSLASRYTAFSLLYIIGFIMVTTMLLVNNRVRSQLKPALVLGFITTTSVLLIFSYIGGLKDMKRYSASLKSIRECTHQEDPDDQCLLSTYHSPELERKYLKYLKQKHWGGY